MITYRDGVFSLQTKNTGYYFKITDGLLENLHYGAKLDLQNAMPLCEKLGAGFGGDVVLDKATSNISALQLCLEASPLQKGDFRAPTLSLELQSQGYTAALTYDSYYINDGCISPVGLASAYAGDQTLCVSLKASDNLVVRLFYTVYEESNVITRRVEIENRGINPITVRRAMSFQLDLPRYGFKATTFTGAWARERHETEAQMSEGCFSFQSRTGVSSSFCNPFFMLCDANATEKHGDAYAFNLIYSGSHEGFIETSPFGKTRIASGIQHEGFSYTLNTGEIFCTPEAVLSFSESGKGGVSRNMHSFVNNHIVRGKWQKKERPVLFNNWEATYFDFNEGKIMRLAKEAAKLGAELFVLDDGWFGDRNDDTRGLGDYNVNRKKLAGGLSGLCEKIKALGMSFGLWFEPEMVNVNSNLYRSHPDWAVKAPGIEPSEGRNQLVLDLCQEQVREYIINNVNNILKSADISYVKWDMNRNLTDMFSSSLKEQGRFCYEYVRGLYEIWQAVTQANPEVLFEGCASGGNRFDLGVLCYMPQIWTSDDTDSYERLAIQEGTSYGYPLSAISCHVSASPNHQAARQSPLEARFDVAAFGVLGYELDLAVLSPAEKKVIREQIAWYKAQRRLLQFGIFYRIAKNNDTKSRQWIIVAPDFSKAVLGDFTGILKPNSSRSPVRLQGLSSEMYYSVKVREEFIDIRTFGSLINHILPIKVNTQGHLMHAAADMYMMPCEKEEYLASGSLLMNAGLKLKQAFSGTGYNENVRLLPDFSGRLYYIEQYKGDEK